VRARSLGPLTDGPFGYNRSTNRPLLLSRTEEAKRCKPGSCFERLQCSAYVGFVSATDVIKELEELPSKEREKVLRWLQQQGLEDLWRRADELMDDAPKPTEDEILKLPRVRPPGF